MNLQIKYSVLLSYYEILKVIVKEELAVSVRSGNVFICIQLQIERIKSFLNTFNFNIQLNYIPIITIIYIKSAIKF